MVLLRPQLFHPLLDVQTRTRYSNIAYYCHEIRPNANNFPLVRQFGRCLLNMRVSFSRRWPSDNGLPSYETDLRMWQRHCCHRRNEQRVVIQRCVLIESCIARHRIVLKATAMLWNVSLRFGRVQLFLPNSLCHTQRNHSYPSVYWTTNGTPLIFPILHPCFHIQTHVWIGIRHTSHIHFQLHNSVCVCVDCLHWNAREWTSRVQKRYLFRFVFNNIFQFNHRRAIF